MSNLAIALRLAEAGIATFPCRPRALVVDGKVVSKPKTPLVNAWQRNSTTDASTIAEWWTQFDDALPGIDLRKAGLIPLDGDRHHADVDGVAALRDLVKQHRIDMRHVPIVHTPNNGVHLYFSNDAQLGNSTGSLPAGIDVRGAGLTIAPHTTMPDGRIYRPAGPCLLSAFKAGTIPPLPEAIVEIIRTPKFSSLANNPAVACSDRRARAFAQAALAGCAADLSRMPKDSGRNVALNGVAYRLGRMVANGWLDQAEVVHSLRAAANSNGLVAEDGPRSIEMTIKSGLNAGLRNPHPGLGERAA